MEKLLKVTFCLKEGEKEMLEEVKKNFPNVEIETKEIVNWATVASYEEVVSLLNKNQKLVLFYNELVALRSTGLIIEEQDCYVEGDVNARWHFLTFPNGKTISALVY